MGNRETVEHDLELMLRHGDLISTSSELLSDQVVACRLIFEFTDQRLKPEGGFDIAKSLELPVDKRLGINDHRLVVCRRGNESAYRGQLQLTWTSAAAIPSEAVVSYGSEHTAVITGGRVAGCIGVSTRALHIVKITQTGRLGFAFGSARSLDGETVFLHRRYAPEGFALTVGRKVRCVIIKSPRGYQARVIEPFSV
jgi:hypothetical protein